jgi:hypothetical protein
MPKEPVQISFEDLLGGNYHDTQFVKVKKLKTLQRECDQPSKKSLRGGKRNYKEETVEQSYFLERKN